jgi:hypothetical protein
MEKIIQDFPTYAITSDGLIRDLRTGNLHNGHSVYGYRAINLVNPIIKKTFLIHRLVALHFIENPNNYKEIDHINRKPEDNRVENLRWCDDYDQVANRGDFKNNKLNEKYICKEKESYRVQITRHKEHLIKKRFKTLEEAIKFRDEFIESHPI